MTNKKTPVRTRNNPPLLTSDEQPLLRLLVAEATRRGDTLAALAKALGVTYGRLAQWRRGAAQIGKAARSVHEKAALYLGLPGVLVLTLAGIVSLRDMVWPDRESISGRVGIELERLRHDPFLAAFVPATLSSAEPEVRLLVAFLYRQLCAPEFLRGSNYHWLTALHQAAVGNAAGARALGELQKSAAGSVF